MPKFYKGALISCDTPTRQYILHLNNEKAEEDRFVVNELDDTHLFVRSNAVAWIEQRVKEHLERQVYTAHDDD